MRFGDRKIFSDKEKLTLLVNFRLNGYATTSLAIVFSCDVSSIRAQLDKYRIVPQSEVYTIERLAADIIGRIQPPEPKWEEIEGVKYSLGKSYKDYLKEAYPHKNLVVKRV